MSTETKALVVASGALDDAPVTLKKNAARKLNAMTNKSSNQSANGSVARGLLEKAVAT